MLMEKLWTRPYMKLPESSSLSIGCNCSEGEWSGDSRVFPNYYMLSSAINKTDEITLQDETNIVLVSISRVYTIYRQVLRVKVVKWLCWLKMLPRKRSIYRREVQYGSKWTSNAFQISSDQSADLMMRWATKHEKTLWACLSTAIKVLHLLRNFISILECY